MDFSGAHVYADLDGLRTSPAKEATTPNAKSILLTEDNLITLRFDAKPAPTADEAEDGGFAGPDLIQNLPKCLRSGGRRSGPVSAYGTPPGGALKPDDTYESGRSYHETNFDEDQTYETSEGIYHTLQR